ncbi:UdgX family uracil-DNA binding protein [Pelagerythrobacter marensis]|uniref:Type-4 uracil-DNA glycosylase n=1 Tax=Pelagerythrobacter marensis TaxID=543877 RepID=A0A0G3X900_9SPHN|nr:UdgX family uracil-DNA binding protein [Pelagerythrobacter marensis]AKM07667.1 Uracil-DNA glycosylase:Phage SPO1 DNA polymerase-related protein [Pelagerythrobacter marensis]
MTAANASSGPSYTVVLPQPDDFAFWRDRARALMQQAIAPEAVVWTEAGATADLFAGGSALPAPSSPGPEIRANRRFLQLAKNAALHSDPRRFSLLYRLLWRLQANGRLMEDRTDRDVRLLEELDKAVRRDSHKMHAFVRFRRVPADRDTDAGRYVAWFEPEHHIVRANAGFFQRRFASMAWSILTPRGCLHWDGDALTFGPPARREDAPQGDSVEDLWRAYYASIFNPARLKIKAMTSEMPRKYWKNLPEATIIPALVAGAQKREAQMIAAGAPIFEERPQTLEGIGAAIEACRKCAIGCSESRSVMGEGPIEPALMIVGEQPGDREERERRPFVGPAGQLLDRHLEKAAIPRDKAYLTNAVKHFKHRARGKRRIHQTPGAKEIDTCRWWLETERAIVKPRVILALGASAARAILGRSVSISKVRGEPMILEDGTELWITAHPSYLLRLEGDAAAEQTRLFERDLAAVRQRLDEEAA